MSPARPVTVLLVDDHPAILLGVQMLLRTRGDIEVLDIAHDPDHALELSREKRPDVVCLDIAFPRSDVDGYELCRKLREERPRLELVVYTGLVDPYLVSRARDVGARSIVSKLDGPRELVRAVLLAARHAKHLSPTFAHEEHRPGPQHLTDKQLTALRLVAEGLDRREIAERMNVGEETVKTHLAEARRRLGARSSAQAVALGLRHTLLD